MIKMIVLALALPIAAICAGEHDSELDSLAMKGGTLSQQEVAKLEDNLKAAPDDFDARVQLLGYYFRQVMQGKDARNLRAQHIFWLIEKHPEMDFAGSHFATLSPGLEVVDFPVAKALWIKQAKEHKNNATVLGNAAHFLTNDPVESEKYLRLAKELEPNNPKWSESLSQLHQRSGWSLGGEEKLSMSVLALKELEDAQKLDQSVEGRFYKLDSLTKLAFDAADYINAKDYAEQLIKAAEVHRDDWNYGNAIHHGNLILGRLAMKDGKLDDAKIYLQKSGGTPGSPQLDTFGPNMTLAKDLLEGKGENAAAVIDYFVLCGAFWKMGAEKLSQWTADVKAGRAPEFGPNLMY